MSWLLGEAETGAHIRECLIDWLALACFHLRQPFGNGGVVLLAAKCFHRQAMRVAINQDVSTLGLWIDDLKFAVTDCVQRGSQFGTQFCDHHTIVPPILCRMEVQLPRENQFRYKLDKRSLSVPDPW